MQTCLESGLLFQPKLMAKCRWVGGKVISGSVGKWKVTLGSVVGGFDKTRRRERDVCHMVRS